MRNRSLVFEIAGERIEILSRLARLALKEGQKDLARRYVRLAREMGRHYRIRGYNKTIAACRSCSTPLIPGLTCSVRLASKGRRVIYVCECGRESSTVY